MTDSDARALRQASGRRQAEARESERLTLDEAANVCGLRAPVTASDLVELAQACELGGVRTNLDDEAGSWRELRHAAREAWRRLMAGPTWRVCAVCGGRRFTERFGIVQCGRCGAMTAAKGGRDAVL